MQSVKSRQANADANPGGNQGGAGLAAYSGIR